MKKDITYVIGHKNPDTDSVCAAIGLAELKKNLGMQNVIAARAGDVNPQTAFILDYFKIQPPKYLPNVYVKARDVMSTEIVTVSEGTPLFKVMDLMREEKIRFVPVLDATGRPKGVLTLMELAKRFIGQASAESRREVTTSFRNIIETLKGEAVLDFLGDREETFSVYVAAMARESFAKALSGKNARNCIVVVGDRFQVQKTSVEMGVGILIATGGFPVGDEIIGAARAKGVSIIVSPLDSATTASLVRLSTPACRVSDGRFESASPEELADEVKWKLGGANGVLVLNEEGVMQGLITKSNLLRPSKTNLVLVDHNELSQSVDGADKVNIIEVVDHHRIGNFQTAQPIPFVCEPVGSTSTLVSELYQRRGVEIRKDIAGLLLAGVLSDTVILRSPTTTDRDRSIVRWLEERSGLDHAAFGSEIFSATSSLRKRGAEAAVNGDYKVFEAKGRRFGIGQVETIGFDEFYGEKGRLKDELTKALEKKDLKFSALLVTDIVYGTSLLLAVGEKEVLHKLDYPKVEESVFELKGVLSRKKQVVPHILNVFNQAY